MLILTLRTDKQDSELGLYEDKTQLAYVTWQAHRQLAETIHQRVQELLDETEKNLRDIRGVVCYKGPGSFTGLRIGLSVANALAYGSGIPIVGIEGEEDWLQKGLTSILNGQNDQVVIPEYGAPAHITHPKK